jgi:hypothetical protein
MFNVIIKITDPERRLIFMDRFFLKKKKKKANSVFSNAHKPQQGHDKLSIKAIVCNNERFIQVNPLKRIFFNSPKVSIFQLIDLSQ